MNPEQASSKYHWIKYDKDTNTIEMFLDNYMLSSARVCEAKFHLEHLLNIKPRYTPLGTTDNGKVIRKPWFFDFGEYFHWCLEQFYVSFKEFKQPPKIDDWLKVCHNKWDEMKLDDYKNSIVKADVTKYESLGGWEGCAGLLVGYYTYYMDQRLRIIDTEITFGHNREVLVGKTQIFAQHLNMEDCLININCYLTGRIDLLVDNGYKIGPVDHKTTGSFDGYEHEDFNPHDGMCGYILAIHEILKNYSVDDQVGNKAWYPNKQPQCMGGWIHHISLAQPSTPRDKHKQPGPRFKVTPLDKTLEQLEDYKARQLSTFKRIAELLFNDKVPEWNTINCNNIFFRKCEYKPIHEQPSSQWQDMIDRFYTIGPQWDTRDHSNKEKDEEDKKETSNII